MQLAPGTILGAYEILELLGRGGMGEVYRARDRRLERDVAIKVLHESATADTEALARFEREARTVATVTHPNIVAIYDVGREGGIFYAVTELLEGRTLREAMTDASIAWRRAVEIGASVADGLAAAHARGMVHRDLKPENVFLTRDGVVKLLDFGLARPAPQTAEGGGSSASTTLMKSATVSGTIGYMAPEQVRGLETDPRADLFSLGCVLYEMVAGRRAFLAQTPLDTIASLLRDNPPGLVDGGLPVPVELDRLVFRCLEKDPADRFQSARDLAFALRALAHSAGEPVREGSTRRPRSLAVLPLRNLSGDPEQDFFADGMTETLIADLSGIEDVRITSRAAAMRYKGLTFSLAEISRELGVEAIVEGSVLRSGKRVRVTVELVHAASGTNIWAQSYERDVEDILALQGQLVRAIAGEIRGRLSPRTQARLSRSRPVDPVAYEAFLKGRYCWNRRTEESVLRGIGHFNQAIAIDPTYALAYLGVAESYNILGFYYCLPPKESFPLAKAAALRALEMEPDLTEAHAVVAYARLYHDWDRESAETDFRRTLDRNPDSSEGHRYLGNHLVACGRLDEALEEFRIARRLDPLSLINNAAVGWVHYFRREYDRALLELRKTRDLDRTFALASLYSGWALTQAGRHAEALTELQRAAAHGGEVPLMQAYLAFGHARAGDTEAARRILEDLGRTAGQRYVAGVLVALVHLGLGDHGAAFAWLDRACDERAHWLVFLDQDPVYDELRQDPRFQRLRERVKRMEGGGV